MENEIQESLEGSEEINPFQFGNTIEDPFEIIAKRKENYFAKCELWCTFPTTHQCAQICTCAMWLRKAF